MDWYGMVKTFALIVLLEIVRAVRCSPTRCIVECVEKSQGPRNCQVSNCRETSRTEKRKFETIDEIATSFLLGAAECGASHYSRQAHRRWHRQGPEGVITFALADAASCQGT
jgi:hypothetical protein